ncbi:MAG: DUF6159 family protein [Fuerstiella sp.]|nr:DUF6159 family protein [Fuerstiella sp.]
MFERISNGISLAKQCFRVLMLDKELLLFPLLSGVSCIAVLASFAAPLWGSDLIAPIVNEGQLPKDPLAWVILAAFYFVNYFVIVFFNSALVACAIIRLKGGDPGVGDGLRASMARLPQICGWAAVSASVGLILRIVESRSERAGQILASVLGLAWTITTYFVIPVLVVEKVGPIEATKRSLSVVRKTWGEAMTANYGIGLVTFLGLLPGIAAIIGGMILANGSHGIGIAVLIAGGCWLLLVSLISSALNTILLGALYLYAAEGQTPEGFDQGVLGNAFVGR